MGKMRLITTLTLSILLFSYTLNAEEKNYCEDPEENAKWEALIQKHPADMQLLVLSGWS